jgi:hypothetical protein
MPRPLERVCLQDGLKLDLNRLAQNGFIKPGANIGSLGIRWTHSYWGEIASGMISADMSGQNEGWLRIQLGNLDQTIILVARHRHFGGKQRYFMCENRPASVLWKPNGATRFCSDRPGDAASPTSRNSTTRPTGRTLERLGSNRD